MTSAWSVVLDATMWIEVPARSNNRPSDVDLWASEIAQGYVDREIVTEDAVPIVSELLREVQRIAAQTPDHGRLYAYMPDPAVGVLAVTVGIGPTSGRAPAELVTELTMGQDLNLFDRPARQEFSTVELGAGVREIRLADDGSGAACASVIYAFRTQACDLVVTTQSFDLALIMSALDDVDEFVSGIAYEVAP